MKTEVSTWALGNSYLIASVFTGEDKTSDSAKSKIMVLPRRGIVKEKGDAIEHGREDLRTL